MGEYSISDNFLRSQAWTQKQPGSPGSNRSGGGAVMSGSDSVGSGGSSGDPGKVTFGLNSVHTRKISTQGMQSLSGSMPLIQSLTCWEPQFDLADLASLRRVRRLTLLRLAFNDAVVRQVLTTVLYTEDKMRGLLPT